MFTSNSVKVWHDSSGPHACHGLSLTITCYAVASVREPCEGSRHFIENVGIVGTLSNKTRSRGRGGQAIEIQPASIPFQ